MPELFSQPLSRLLMHENEKIVQEALNIWGAHSTDYSLFTEALSGLTEWEYKDGHLDEEFLGENLADYPHKKMIISWIRNEAKRFPERNLGFSFDEAVELLRAEEHSNVVTGTILIDPFMDDYEKLKDLLQSLEGKELEEEKFGQDYFMEYFKDFSFPHELTFWSLSKLCSFPQFKDNDVLRTIRFDGESYRGKKINPISELPEISSDVSFIKIFSAVKNVLTSVPDWFEEMDGLEELDLENNDFRKIPEAIFTQKNLRVLNMSRNWISEIPDDIARLQKLEKLDVGRKTISLAKHRGLKKISKKIIKCSNLQRLGARGCYLNKGEIKSYLSKGCRVSIS